MISDCINETNALKTAKFYDYVSQSDVKCSFKNIEAKGWVFQKCLKIHGFFQKQAKKLKFNIFAKVNKMLSLTDIRIFAQFKLLIC